MPKRLEQILDNASPELMGALDHFVDFVEAHTEHGYRIVSPDYKERDYKIDDPQQIVPADLLRVGCLSTRSHVRQQAIARLLTAETMGGQIVKAGQEVFAVVYESAFENGWLQMGAANLHKDVDSATLVVSFVDRVLAREEAGKIVPLN